MAETWHMSVFSTLKRVIRKRLDPLGLSFLYTSLHSFVQWIKSKDVEPQQQALLEKTYAPDEKKLIVFLIPAYETISGGILSIFSLCSESRRFDAIHGAKVLLSTFPKKYSYVKNTLFKNNEPIFHLSLVLRHFRSLTSLVLHIPEYAATGVWKDLSKTDQKKLQSIPYVHINILNQNAELMPLPEQLIRARELCHELTQTTAHRRYCTQEQSDTYHMPVHLFSTGVDKGNYTYTPWDQKEDILIISPDPHPEKARILKDIAHTLPHIRQIIISGMPYEKFKALISRAKFSLTFGEGFDGYYIEPAFCGSVGFTVYNNTFFPSEDFRHFFGVYDDYNQLKHHICEDMRHIEENKPLRAQHLKRIYAAMEKEYSFSQYIRNIEYFYRKRYTFKPLTQVESGAVNLI